MTSPSEPDAAPTGQTGRLLARLRARLSKPPRYVGNRGDLMRRDPTYGQIDADIQRQAAELLDDPTDLGRRVAIENTLQARRDRRG